MMQLLKRHGLLESNKVILVKTDSIVPNPGQPRRIFDSAGLQQLSESIKLYGVLQPLTVRRLDSGCLELVAGERRLRASKIAGLPEVPCIVLGADEKQSSLIALVENLQRCDLDYFEEAEGLKRLIYQFGLSQDEAARRVGKSQSSVANKLRILRHSPEHIQAMRENGLTERHARALLRLESPEDRTAAIETIIERKLNVAQTDDYIEAFLTSASDVRSDEPEACPQPSNTLQLPAEEKVPRQKIRALYVFKDLRLFLNTVTRAVETMRRSGLPAEIDREEIENEIILTIKIPKKVS